MRFTYDESINAAYIQLAKSIAPGEVAFTYPCDPAEVGGMIHLDFGEDGRLLGIEVLGADKLLPPEFLASAGEEPGSDG
ncbi:MAG: DUF2283 domain-containing protein [Sulfitobacter sp.]|nr:DUF2283 domain-containing protein [Sulfitobacter sp.]